MKEATQPKLVRPKVNKILTTTLVFVLINVVLSAFLTYDFYLQAGTGACSMGSIFGCGGIQESEYALLAGVPHALIGIIFYTISFIGIGGVIIKIPFHRAVKFLRPQMILDLIRWASYVAALYAFYLTYAEIAILKTYSLPYLTQQLMIFVILGLQIWANVTISEGKKDTQVCEFC